MPLGAVRQFCMHKKATIQELDNMLKEFDLQRSSVEINRNTTLWSHNSVWNRKYMDPNPGYTLQQLWEEAEPYISQKVTRSREVTEDALRHNVRELQTLPSASPPSNLFVQNLGRPNRGHIPPQNACPNAASGGVGTNTMRNKAVAILDKLQEGRPALFQQDGGAMLIAMVLDRPLAEHKPWWTNHGNSCKRSNKSLTTRKRNPFWSKCYKPYKGTLRRKPQAVAKDASRTGMTTNFSSQCHEKLRPPGGAPGWSFLLKSKGN